MTHSDRSAIHATGEQAPDARIGVDWQLLLRRVLTNPHAVPFAGSGWWANDDVQNEIVEDATQRLSRCALDDSVEELSEREVLNALWAAYGRKLHDGVAAGDEGALGELRALSARHVHRVLRARPYAARLVSIDRQRASATEDSLPIGGADEEDFVQQVWTKAWEKINAGEIRRPESLYAVVLSIARNHIIDELKKRSKDGDETPPAEPPEEGSTGDDVDPVFVETLKRLRVRSRTLNWIVARVRDDTLLPIDALLMILHYFEPPAVPEGELPIHEPVHRASPWSPYWAILNYWQANPDQCRAYLMSILETDDRTFEQFWQLIDPDLQERLPRQRGEITREAVRDRWAQTTRRLINHDAWNQLEQILLEGTVGRLPTFNAWKKEKQS